MPTFITKCYSSFDVSAGSGPRPNVRGLVGSFRSWPICGSINDPAGQTREKTQAKATNCAERTPIPLSKQMSTVSRLGDFFTQVDSCKAPKRRLYPHIRARVDSSSSRVLTVCGCTPCSDDQSAPLRFTQTGRMPTARAPCTSATGSSPTNNIWCAGT
jgi:hypothetical protein